MNIDAFATAQLMGLATKSIKVGTWVAHTYLRLPYLCAKAAMIAADATEGRMVLGLGVSHQPVNRALGIEMPAPARALREYALEVMSWLRGDGPATHLPQQPSPYHVPVYLAALTSQNVELPEKSPTVSCHCSGRWSGWREANAGSNEAARNPTVAVSWI